MLAKVDFMGQQVTRLIAGDNPVYGHTYISEMVSSKELISFHTEEKVLEAMQRSLDLGYNTWLPLGSDFMLRAIGHHKERVEKPLQFIFQSYAPIDFAVNLRMMADVDPLAIYHRGTDTDGLYEAGDFGLIRDRLKMIRDKGIPAGLGTHVPEVILRAEEEGWECDFYVTCLYNTRKQAAVPSSFLTGKSKELVFRAEDKEPMLQAIRQVEKPCIAFKVYAGGQIFRGLGQDQWPAAARKALAEAYAGIKPDDIICLGFFQRDKDQLAENAHLAASVLAES